MERLTSEINGRAVPVKFDLDFTLDMPQRDWRGLQEIFDRLAAYEETGLEPEEIERILNSYGHNHPAKEYSFYAFQADFHHHTDWL